MTTPLHASPRTQLAKLQDGFYLGKGLPKFLGGDKAEKSHEAKIGAALAGIRRSLCNLQLGGRANQEEETFLPKGVCPVLTCR